MRLNAKIGLSLILPLGLVLPLLGWLLADQVLSRFVALETTELQRNHERLIEAIDAELDSLERVARDWGHYDQTYAYMGGDNPAYPAENFTAATMENLQLDVVGLFDPEGRPHAHFLLDHAQSSLAPLPPELLAVVSSALGSGAADDGSKGVLDFRGRVMQVARSRILDSDGAGEPRGWLLMARFVDEGTVERIAQRIRVFLRFFPLAGAAPSAEQSEAVQALRGQRFWQRLDTGRRSISSFSLLHDLQDRPILLMQVSMPRGIYREGLDAVRTLLGFSALAMGVLLILIFLLLQRVALRRLLRMSERLHRLEADADRQARLRVSGDDEIGQLGCSINSLLDRLQAFYASRQRGAERQRELNALLVRMVTDDALLQGDAEALYRAVDEALRAATPVCRWGLWLFDERGEALECLRGGPAAIGCSRDELARRLRELTPGTSDPFPLGERAPGAARAWLFPFELETRRGALLIECAGACATEEEDSLGFLLATTQLIERALQARFQLQREAQLREKAELDPLTGLANRARFELALRNALQAMRDPADCVGVLFVDLDHFKPVNDTHGHAVGDWLLCQVAQRLRDVVRAGDLVGRLGGDEFVLLLGSLRDAAAAERVAAKLAEALAQPFAHPAVGPLRIGGSIGIAVAPIHGREAEVLLDAADQAMYRAKQGGRGRWFSAG